jgi:DNA-binding NtrC family response regulator
MKTPRILIVDDDIDLLATVAKFLKDELVCEIDTKTGGEDALTALEKESFDILLLDKQMPGMDGFEVLHEVQQRGLNIVVIMMTRLGDPAVIDLIEERGAIYVPKPVTEKALAVLIRRELTIKGGYDLSIPKKG